MGSTIRERTSAGMEGMARAGQWARREARRAQLELARTIKWRLLGVGAGALAGGIAALVLVNEVPMGVAVGVIWASTAWAMSMFVVQMTGTASRLMGGEAESWTADELRRLPPPWWAAHAVLLEHSDVDHVVGGPAGVYVLETKWTMLKRLDSLEKVARSQVNDNAASIRSRLRAYGNAVEIQRVVVLWGDHVPRSIWELGPGVTALHGSLLTAWLEEQPTRAELGDIEQAHAALRRYEEIRARGSDAVVTRFEEAGISGVLNDVVAGLFGGFLGLLVAATAWSRSLTLGLVTSVALIALGFAARRSIPRLYSAGLGLAASAMCMTVFAGVAVALDEFA